MICHDYPSLETNVLFYLITIVICNKSGFMVTNKNPLKQYDLVRSPIV